MSHPRPLPPVARPPNRTNPSRARGGRAAVHREARDRARTRILAAATHLFAHQGLENVTFGDVARRSRLSRPLVYFYFPDLRTLFLETALLAGERWHERLIKAAGGSGSGLDTILDMARAYLAFHAEEPEQFLICMTSAVIRRDGRAPTELEARIMLLERVVMDLVEGAVKRGVRDGSMRRDVGDPLLVSLNLWAFVHGLVQLGTGQRDTIELAYGVRLRQFVDGGLALLRSALARPR